MSYSERNRNTRNRPTERIGRSAGWNQNRDFRDQTKITPSKPVIFQTRTQSELNSPVKHLFEEYVNPDLIVSRIYPIEPQQALLDSQNHKGIKLVTVTPIYITALHLTMQENQFFGIYKHRCCFYDFGVKEFFGTINRDRYTEAAEQVVPQLEKRAPWLFEERDESRREDPIVLLTKPQDFNTAYVLQYYLHSTFPRDLQEEFDECLRSTHPNKTNVIRFVELNKKQLYSGVTDPHLYHKVTSMLLDATLKDGQSRLIISQIESSLVVRFLQCGGQECFIADEYIFRKSFVDTTLRTVLKSLPNNEMAQVKFNYGIFRQRQSTNDNKAVVGDKRGYNSDVVAVYEEYYAKLIPKVFSSTKLDCVTAMNQVIDADLRYSRFPGLILYMVSHALSMLEQRCFGRPLQTSKVHIEGVSHQIDKSPTSSHSKHMKRSRPSSRSRSSSHRDASSDSRSKPYSRSSSPSAIQHRTGSRETPNSHRQVHDGPQHMYPTTDQSLQRSMSPNEYQSTINQSLNTVTEDERANRFDRALLREQVDANSPLQSRSNSLVITDITCTDVDQPAHIEPQATVELQNNTNHVSGQKRQREESSHEPSEDSKIKRRKKENLVADVGTEQCTPSQEKQGDSSTITNAGHAIGEESAVNDELLELLTSWQ